MEQWWHNMKFSQQLTVAIEVALFVFTIFGTLYFGKPEALIYGAMSMIALAAGYAMSTI
jgi:hypothetical protein